MNDFCERTRQESGPAAGIESGGCLLDNREVDSHVRKRGVLVGIAPGRKGSRFVWIALTAILIGSGLWVAGSWRPSAQPLERARWAYQQRRWRDALSLAEQQFEIDGNDREALRLMAHASARLQREPLTTTLYLRLGSGNVQAEDLFLLGEGLMRQGKYAEGEDMWRKALESDPKHAETLSELARRLARTDRVAEAATMAERLSALPGWESRGAAMLGLARLTEAEPAAAVNALQQALRVDPNVNDTGFTARDLKKRLARGLLQIHRPDEAAAVLRADSQLASDQEAQWLASRAALQRGDRSTALTTWQKATSAGLINFAEPSPFVGSARCAECHGEIHDVQQSSRHAQTFHDAEQVAGLKLPPQTYSEPETPRIVAAVTPGTTPATLRVTSGAEAMTAVMDYVLGSGRHAFTPIGRDERGVLRELRLTYYASLSRWDRTPGHKARPANWEMHLGEPQTDDALRRCLNCHTTNYRAAIMKAGPEAADRGIGCERCHGPGGNHVAAIELSFPDLAIEKLRRTAPGVTSRAMTVCGECHGPGGRPVDLDDPTSTVRFQALTLTWSKCYTKSRETLDCLTCHSAHGDLEKTPGYYEAKCLACHTAETPSLAGQSRLPSSNAADSRPGRLPGEPT